MAFLWSFADAALLSAVGVAGKGESRSVPPEPGDRLEDGECLLRLPVSSLIWKENGISDPPAPRPRGPWPEGPALAARVLRGDRHPSPTAGPVPGDRAVAKMAGPFRVAQRARPPRDGRLLPESLWPWPDAAHEVSEPRWRLPLPLPVTAGSIARSQAPLPTLAVPEPSLRHQASSCPKRGPVGKAGPGPRPRPGTPGPALLPQPRTSRAHTPVRAARPERSRTCPSKPSSGRPPAGGPPHAPPPEGGARLAL